MVNYAKKRVEGQKNGYKCLDMQKERKIKAFLGFFIGPFGIFFKKSR